MRLTALEVDKTYERGRIGLNLGAGSLTGSNFVRGLSWSCLEEHNRREGRSSTPKRRSSQLKGLDNPEAGANYQGKRRSP